MNAHTKLQISIEDAKDRWDERSTFKLYGVKNLSLSDLDDIELYNDMYSMNMGHELSEPMGNVREVLERAGVLKKETK